MQRGSASVRIQKQEIAIRLTNKGALTMSLLTKHRSVTKNWKRVTFVKHIAVMIVLKYAQRLKCEHTVAQRD